MSINIGIDVSKEKFDLCWLKEISSGKKKTKVFKNIGSHFDKVAQWLLKNTKASSDNQSTWIPSSFGEKEIRVLSTAQH